jgi:hypothetical protein
MVLNPGFLLKFLQISKQRDQEFNRLHEIMRDGIANRKPLNFNPLNLKPLSLVEAQKGFCLKR